MIGCWIIGDGECDGEALGLALGEVEGDPLGETDGDALGEADGEIAAKPKPAGRPDPRQLDDEHPRSV